MKNFLKIAEGLEVSPIAMAIHLHPELWNQYGQRKAYEGSPHLAMSDIWVRFNDPKNLELGYDKFTGQHDSVWYPSINDLAPIKPLVFWLMGKVMATRLGGVLITKIPPKGRILPHADKGWHPEYYNCKVYVPIQSNAGCQNRVGDERVSMKVGEAWYFNNLVEHEVVNEGDDDRITLIVCMRCE